MGARERLLAPVGLTLLLAGCASGASKSEARAAAGPPPAPPQTVTPAAPNPPEPGVEEPVAVPPPASRTVVIDEGTPEPTERSLAEVAADERRRRETSQDAVVTVTDKNLGEHATGKLTYSSAPAAGEGETSTAASDAAEAADREEYWRSRVREQRETWAETVDDILRLEQEVSELRLRFYAEDDPYVRDGRIKPRWDRALDELGDAREEAERLERELDSILEEGRRAGALPGWLREGSELEPEERPYGEQAEAQEDEAIVGEPDIVDENR